ncbi:hypothetical protein ACE6H2_020291 [Prunus campanulata]
MGLLDYCEVDQALLRPEKVETLGSALERDERMLSFTRSLVALGETVALRTRPSQVYQAVETLQQILEGTNIRDDAKTITYD